MWDSNFRERESSRPGEDSQQQQPELLRGGLNLTAKLKPDGYLRLLLIDFVNATPRDLYFRVIATAYKRYDVQTKQEKLPA
ncbi:hypothetical protein ACEPAI_8206 [Sanghuangporus weigelae]